MVVHRRGAILVARVGEACRSLFFKNLKCLVLAKGLNRNMVLVQLFLGLTGLDPFLVLICNCVA